jgi:homogentisate 1,2-dioxygenase
MALFVLSVGRFGLAHGERQTLALEINFKTSALGGVRIEILDEAGAPMEGYDSGRLFGNSLSRPVDFDAPLSALAGKAVRLRITLTDADLYSFRFY